MRSKRIPTSELPEASARGRRNRESGHGFERKVVHIFVQAFLDQNFSDIIRRSDQGHRAWLPDVAGIPGLWPECQNAQNTTPEQKLEQALRDTHAHRATGKICIPLAITHEKGTRAINAMLRLSDLVLLSVGLEDSPVIVGGVYATITLDAFIVLYREASLYNNPRYADRLLDTGSISQSMRGEIPPVQRATPKRAPVKE